MNGSSTADVAATDGTCGAAAVRERIEGSPYLALASALSVGWVLGRRLRLPLLGAVAGIGVRVAAASVIERLLAELAAPSRKP
jgi:hypothetical protein